jgi:hypothetical protein
MALALERADNAFGDCPDVNVGAAGRDDHDIGEDGFAVQVDCDDVSGLGIFETGQDSPHECTGFRLNRELGRAAKTPLPQELFVSVYRSSSRPAEQPGAP